MYNLRHLLPIAGLALNIAWTQHADALVVTKNDTNLSPGRSPLTGDFTAFVKDNMDFWNIPGMAIAVIDNHDVFAEVCPVRQYLLPPRYAKFLTSLLCRVMASQLCLTIKSLQKRSSMPGQQPRPRQLLVFRHLYRMDRIRHWPGGGRPLYLPFSRTTLCFRISGQLII